MAYLFDIIRYRRGDFLLLFADQTVQQYLDKLLLMRPKDPRALIVARDGPKGTDYYLFLREEIPQALSEKNAECSLLDALSLNRAAPTPTRPLYSSVRQAPERCVVLQNGRVFGFFARSLFRTYFQVNAMAGVQGLAPVPTRTQLNTELPEFLAQGAVTDLEVWLAPNLERSGPDAMLLAEGSEVTIQVTTGFGLRLEGPRECRLKILADGVSPRVRFPLRASTLNPQPVEDGWQGQVTVACLQRGRTLGAITLSPTIFKYALEAENARLLNGSSILSPEGSAPADLTLTIHEEYTDGRPALWVRLSVEPEIGAPAYFGPVFLNQPSQDYFLGVLESIGGLFHDPHVTQAIAEQRISQQGMRLFRTLFPSSLRAILWDLRKQIQSIHIVSNEAWIPWEIVRMYGGDEDETTADAYFCEYQLTRSIPLIGCPAEVRLDRVAVVAPADAGLPARNMEVKTLQDLTLKNQHISVHTVRPVYSEVLSLLAQADYTALHFTGHSQFERSGPYHSRLLLENSLPLYAEELVGPQENFGKKHPLVFMNSCNSAEGGISLTDIDGWSCAFMKTGAAAFIGSMWKVSDRGALMFMQAFYRHLVKGEVVGEAVRLARQDIRMLPGIDWLAYTAYCDPLARYVDSTT